jgi:hypothetical protein
LDHYALVDEAAPLDSDYLSATVAGTRDLFATAASGTMVCIIAG